MLFGRRLDSRVTYDAEFINGINGDEKNADAEMLGWYETKR